MVGVEPRTMARKSWAQVKEVFHEALRRDTGEREKFLEEACAGDISFRIEVESLLISLAEAESFLEQPVIGEIKKPAEWRLSNGTEISHYRIVEPIGVGGMGEVYLADDLRLNRHVALKILPEHMLADRDRLRRFQREADVVSALNHPNILTIFEFGTEGDVHLFASEYVKGETLRERLSRGRLSVSESLDIAAQITSALIAAHEAGVVHRDIKPENVMIRNDGYVKVLDFGLAKQTEASPASEYAAMRSQLVSQPGLIMGTVAYMSPEQVRARPVDARTDLFSLGVVLYEMLTGASPFSGETTTDVIAATLQIEPPPVSQINRRAPDEIDDIVSRALKKDRLERYQTAMEMSADLKALLKRVSFEEEFGKEIKKAPSTKTTALMPLVEPAAASTAPPRLVNLSDPGPPMIGREKEVAEINDLLRRSDVRLLTLTGIGGTGKTRLAQEVGRRMKQHFPDGVFFVELAAITDPALAVPTIAHALEVPEAGPRNINNTLTDYLTDRSTLLILDNLEQIVDAGPELAQLLRAAAGLKMLVTSRGPLKLSTETEYQVPPLLLPQSGENIPVEELGQFEAVKLFVQRAGRTRPDFALTVDNAAAVSEICRRLDGIPLAIELAAARTKVLSTHAILEKLENRLDVLTGGSKDLPARQQTMRGAIEWSYDLLTEDEREIFRKLSVFAGGFTYSTAEAVISKTAVSSTAGFLDLVTSITEKGLVIPQKHLSETPRFRMLDIVRAYALEMLNASDEAELMHLAHAEYYLELGQQAEPHLKTVDSAKWLSRLEQEHDNLRAAIHWSVENRPEIAAELVSAIRSLWTVHGHLNEGSRLSARILSSGAEMSDNVRWKILTAYGNMSQFRGIFDKAQELYAESLTVARRMDNKAQISQSLRGLGAVAYLQDDLASARKFINEALDISQTVNDRFGIAASLGRLGDIAYCGGDYQESYAYSEDALDIFRDLGYQEGICSKLSTLGAAAFALGDIEVAQTSFEEGLKIALSLEEKINIRHIMSGFAALATESGDFTRAARLDGVAEGLGASIEYAIEPAESQFRDAYLVKLKSALSKSLFEKEYAKGRSMSIDAAKELAFDTFTSRFDGKQKDSPARVTEKALSTDAKTNASRPLLNLKTILIGTIVILLAAAAIWYFAFGSRKQIGSIAVLPFVNESGNPDIEYLSDGMTETLINGLSQLPDLKVKSRSSVFQYKSKEISPEDIGKALSVQAVLNGRMTQHGDKLTLSLSLVDASTGNQIWGERYEVSQADLVSLQSKVTRDVSDELSVKLTGSDKLRLAKNYTENAEAYRLYLKGRYFWDKRTKEGMESAVKNYTDAIALDPNYALAYAGLADCYLFPQTGESPNVTIPKTRALALKALEIDNTLAEAHTTLGFVKMRYDIDWTGAEQEFNQAIALNSNYPVAHQFYGTLLVNTGRTDEGLRELRRAVELDPLSVTINWSLGINLYHARQYDEAITQLQNTLQMNPNHVLTLDVLASTLAQKARYDEAFATLDKLDMLFRDSSLPEARLNRAYIYALSGRHNQARRILDDMNDKTGQQPDDATIRIARIYVALGESEKAFNTLNRAFEDHDFSLIFLKVDPTFDPLRNDPRFQDLLRSAGL